MSRLFQLLTYIPIISGLLFVNFSHAGGKYANADGRTFKVVVSGHGLPHITIQEVLAEAFTERPKSRIALFEYEDAQLANSATFSRTWYPTVSVSHVSNYLIDPVSNGGIGDIWINQSELVFSYDIFSGFGPINRLEAADENLLAAYQVLYGKQIGIALAATQAFVGVYVGRRQFHLALERYNIAVALDKKIQAATFINAEEKATSSQRVKKSYEDKHGIIRDLLTAAINYRRQTGLDSNLHFLVEIPPFNFKYGTSDKYTAKDAFGIALERSPGLQVTEANIRAAAHLREAAKSTYYPRFSIFASGGYFDIDNSEIKNNEHAYYGGGGRATWDLFSPGRVEEFERAVIRVRIASELHRENIDKIAFGPRGFYDLYSKYEEDGNIIAKREDRLLELEQIFNLRETSVLQNQGAAVLDLYDGLDEWYNARINLEDRKATNLLREAEILALTGELLFELGVTPPGDIDEVQ